MTTQVECGGSRVDQLAVGRVSEQQPGRLAGEHQDSGQATDLAVIERRLADVGVLDRPGVELGYSPRTQSDPHELTGRHPQALPLRVGVRKGVAREHLAESAAARHHPQQLAHAVEQPSYESLGGGTKVCQLRQLSAGNRLDQALSPHLTGDFVVTFEPIRQGRADDETQRGELHQLDAHQHHRPVERRDFLAPVVRSGVGDPEDASRQRRIQRHRLPQATELDFGVVTEANDAHRRRRHGGQGIECYQRRLERRGRHGLSVGHGIRPNEPNLAKVMLRVRIRQRLARRSRYCAASGRTAGECRRPRCSSCPLGSGRRPRAGCKPT